MWSIGALHVVDNGKFSSDLGLGVADDTWNHGCSESDDGSSNGLTKEDVTCSGLGDTFCRARERELEQER